MLRGLGADATAANCTTLDYLFGTTGNCDPFALAAAAAQAHQESVSTLAAGQAAQTNAANVIAKAISAGTYDASAAPPTVQAAIAQFTDPTTGQFDAAGFASYDNTMLASEMNAAYQQGMNPPPSASGLPTWLLFVALGVGGYLVWKAVE